MDSSYIVRIYRRKTARGPALVGLVESVGTDVKRAFNDRDGLWRILTDSTTTRRPTRRSRLRSAPTKRR